MKSFLPPAIAGALCLPATYWQTRTGSMAISLIYVVVIGALGGMVATFLSRRNEKPRFLTLASAFVIGGFMGELVGFTHYYIIYGYHDQLLAVGVILSFVEFGGIAVFGGIAACLAALVQHRSTHHSSGLPPTSADV